MAQFLGLDASTQSLTAVLIDTVDGKIIHTCTANFGKDLPEYAMPHGYDDSGEGGEVFSNPLMWLDALDLVLQRMVDDGVDMSAVRAVSGSGQQHGSVYLSPAFRGKIGALEPTKGLAAQLADCFTRKVAPIWMDSSTSVECAEITAALGGEQEVCSRSGSVATERFTGPQIRKFAKQHPEQYAATDRIHLVSSFFASILAGADVAIDRGDGAGMNLMNLSLGDWDVELLAATAEDLRTKLPDVQDSSTVTGTIAGYFVERYGFSADCATVLWSGDNPCSLVGMGASRPGSLVISLGTSDTVFSSMPEAVFDPQGFGHAFGNPMGGFMSLTCFKNGSLAREAVKDRFGLDWSAFDVDALNATPTGNDGLMMLPFFEPEITPRLNTGGIVFNRDGEHTPAQWVRAVLEGQFLNMRLHSQWLGIAPERIRLTGGASRNNGIAQVVANVFGVPVDRLETTEGAGLGAALRAASACGESLDAMETDFCKVDEAFSMSPESGSAEIYATMLPAYSKFLATQHHV